MFWVYARRVVTRVTDHFPFRDRANVQRVCQPVCSPWFFIQQCSSVAFSVYVAGPFDAITISSRFSHQAKPRVVSTFPAIRFVCVLIVCLALLAENFLFHRNLSLLSGRGLESRVNPRYFSYLISSKKMVNPFGLSSPLADQQNPPMILLRSFPARSIVYFFHSFVSVIGPIS